MSSAESPEVKNSADRSGARRCRREPLVPLIVSALRSADNHGLVLADICNYVIAHSADYREQSATSKDGGCGNWRRNVRHILSVRSFFVRTGEQNPSGRGRYWRLDERKYFEYVSEKLPTLSTSASATVAGDDRGTGDVRPTVAATFDVPLVNCESQMFEASPVPVTNLPHSKDVLPAVLRLSSLADHGAMEARVTGITSAPHQHSVNDVCWRQPDLRCYAAQYDANYQQPQLQYLPYSCSRQQSQIVMTQSRDAFCPPAFNSNNCMDAASYTSQQTYPMYGYVGAPSRTSSFHAGYHPCCSCQQMPSYLNIESPGVATPNMLPTIQCRHNQQFNM